MANELNEGERLVKLETEVAVIKDAVLRLEKMLVMREENYVTKDVLEEKLLRRDREIQGLQSGLNDIRSEKQSSKNNLPVWIGIIPSVAAVIVAIIAIYK